MMKYSLHLTMELGANFIADIIYTNVTMYNANELTQTRLLEK